MRSFAERKDGILSSDPAFLPGSQSERVPVKTEVPGAVNLTGITPQPTPATPSSGTTIPVENIPRTPPTPTEVRAVPPPPQSTSPPPATPKTVNLPPPPPPPAPKRRSRLRFLLYFLILSALGYGAGVAYALRSDNFHDFFTEYIPYGEDAVLYFEERSFRKRFPAVKSTGPKSNAHKDENRVTIPKNSGLSWRVQDEKAGSDLTAKGGKHMSAVDANAPKKEEVKQAQQNPRDATPKEKVGAIDRAKNAAASSEPATQKAAPVVVKEEPKPTPKTTPAIETAKTASDTRPPAITPVTQISPLQIANADEQAVQDLVKVVNDLITVINSDNAGAASKYHQPIEKAKDALAAAATKIGALKANEQKAAEARIAEAHREFDEGAKKLLQRIETAQKEDDARYRDEFESERTKIADQYEQRLKTEIQRTQEIAEQRLKNELTEQGIEMKRKFIEEIKSLVESERDGRLSNLSDLSKNVDSLTELTSNWNGVIDTNLATQKLQVAVDAVKSALTPAGVESKPKPFVREMAALKLVAEGDPVVDAAVASINPSAYQRGIPSSSQLIDRFRRVASEVRKAALLPEDAGIASHAASVVLSRVMFKKQGQPEGNDVESVLTRTETLLEEGDLDNAAREMNTLKGWAGVLSKDWLGDVRKVLEVKQALDVIETEARLQCLRVE